MKKGIAHGRILRGLANGSAGSQRKWSSMIQKRALGIASGSEASSFVGGMALPALGTPINQVLYNHPTRSSQWRTLTPRESQWDTSTCTELGDCIGSQLEAGSVLHDALDGMGVSRVFTAHAHTDVAAFEATTKSSTIHSIVAAHGQGAGHMAEGYARATGIPGVALVDSGSGLTNLVTPMQDALCDGTPMITVVAHTRSSLSSPHSREFDLLGITEGCTKWNHRIRSLNELPLRIEEAFSIALGGRPGPVLLEIPAEISSPECTPTTLLNRSPRQPNVCGEGLKPSLPDQPLQGALRGVAKLINIAQRPIFYVGQGIFGGPDGAAVLKKLADKASIPVTTSLQGLGSFDETDPKALHMLGQHGTGYANSAIQEADLVLAVGARFDDRVTGNISKFAPSALQAAKQGRGGIVQFDIAPKNIDKVIKVTDSIVGDCTSTLSMLNPLVDPKSLGDRLAWFEQIEEWKMRYPLAAYKKYATTPTPGLIQAQSVIERLSDLTNEYKHRTIISTGVGQHQMWAAQHYRWRHPRTMLTSGGLGTMGYGLPAAIGAQIARPDCLVIDIDGDASFNMTIAELTTAAKYNIPVKVLLFNNEQMGMISDLQRLYYKEKFVHNRQKNPDFVVASQAYGVQARRIEDPAETDEGLMWLLNSNGPAVLEVRTEQNSCVWPVVPAGKGLHEFITYPEQSGACPRPT